MAISTNSKLNFNSRNSEPNSPMRRSNSFQRPVHTNSPSENARSNSLGNEEKENENDLFTVKPLKPRVPAAVNGTNHFMLPTISAASKINPSPRKKVLTDKNEQLRTSSGSIHMTDFTKDFDQKLDKGFQSPCDTNHLLKCCVHNSHTPTFSQLSDKKPVLLTNTKLASSISPIAPLDADPGFPPYDPKTNYLSPRPQFLHYKPNPRLELYYQKEQSGTKNLEDMFSSENSDTEISEESDPENTQEEYENASSVEAINGSCEKECEDASSVKAVNEVVEHEVFSSEEKRVVKPRFFTRAKVIPVLLVLLIASLAVSYTNSPIFDSPVYEKLSRSKFYEEGFNDFARNLKLWSVYSTSYVNELISSFIGGDELGRLQFSNLTYVREDPFIEMKRFELYEQDEVEPVFEDENELENEIDSESQIEHSIASDLQNDFDLEDKSCKEAPGISFEEAASEVIKGENLLSEFEIESSTAISSFEKAYVLDISQSEVLSLEQVDYIASGFQIETTIVAPTSGTPLEIDSYQEDPENDLKTSENREISYSRNTLEMDASISDHIPDYNSLNQYEALAITLLAIALIASPVLFYLKNKRTNASIYTAEIDRIPMNKKMKSNQSPQDYSPEVDYCPSEISSFDKSYSYSKRRLWGITNEVQSQEMKQKRVSKRESFASSTELSMSDSPSYGSFTTYERLPSKLGFGDDEVITPVRRSSRIKKTQVTS